MVKAIVTKDRSPDDFGEQSCYPAFNSASWDSGGYSGCRMRIWHCRIMPYYDFTEVIYCQCGEWIIPKKEQDKMSRSKDSTKVTALYERLSKDD